LSTEALILDEMEKCELFRNILNLQIANYEHEDKQILTPEELFQDNDFMDFIAQVRVIIFGNVIEFTQNTLDSETE
jgi:hypothetical protein